MTPKEYLRAFKRHYKKMQVVGNQMSAQYRSKWIILMRNAYAIITLLEAHSISKVDIGKVTMVMDKNLGEVLDNTFPNDALLVRIRDLVVSLALYCKRKKGKK